MARFKYIYDPQSAYGGHEFHATTDSVTVLIKHRKPYAQHFRIVNRMTKSCWDEFVAEHDLYNSNHTNPAYIARLASLSAC
jgi:hypothetical protein